MVKNLPAMWETWVLSLDWEDPLEEGKATHSSILAQRIAWTQGRKQSDTTEQISLSFWRRERLPTPVFWPRESHGQYSPWGRKELDTTEQLSLSLCIL